MERISAPTCSRSCPRSPSYVKGIITFANADGGTLILGAEDDGDATGHGYPAEAIQDMLLTVNRHGRGQPRLAQDARGVGAWQQRDLTDEDIVRLILDGTVVKARLDRQATAISLLIVLGIRRDGQKVVLAIKNMGGESEAAWRAVLDDLLARGLAKPELVIVDGGKGLEAALASLWADVPVQRCTVTRNATCSPTHPSTCTTRSRPSSTT